MVPYYRIVFYSQILLERFNPKKHIYIHSKLINSCEKSVSAADSNPVCLFVKNLQTNIFQPTHKMQSASGPPVIQLQLVPKMLAPLVNLWVPEAFVVSFKLETDENILISKARDALEKYKHKVRN